MPEEKKLTDNEIMKGLECCSQEDMCQSCPYGAACLDDKYISIISKDALDLIKRLKAENDELFYKLQGVMWSVDKWLDGNELKQDEVSRATTMREKTLQITEKQQAEIESLRNAYKQCAWERDAFLEDFGRLDANKIKANVIKEFAMRLKKVKVYSLERRENVVPVAQIDWVGQWFIKEMAGE